MINKTIIRTVFTCLTVISFNVHAAFLPAPVESTVTGSLDIIDPDGLHTGAVPLDFNSAMGDFDFMYLGVPGTGYNSSFYNEGSYDFILDSDPNMPPASVTMTVGPDQLGMQTYIDWGVNTYDVLVVWDIATTGNLTTLTAIDMDGDGIRGFKMPNGPFQEFNFVMDVSIETPVPAAVWLFASGLIGLVGLARRKA